MEWPEEYALQKVLPLVSLYDIRMLAEKPSLETTGRHLQPCRLAAFQTNS